MYNLFYVYDCPKCGKVLEDEIIQAEEVDTEHDEIYKWAVHESCGQTVEPRMKDGQHCMEEVSTERAQFYYDRFPPQDEEEYTPDY